MCYINSWTDGKNLSITKEGGIEMNLKGQFPVANLDESQLSKITQLENELRKDTQENIVLIAYDEKDE
ncbi:hypothetical protein BSG1_06824 [Bacillus sp. SG-1]|nr:hypothetical protein BSG1_06824 [Bacillus sp. SG-1]